MPAISQALSTLSTRSQLKSVQLGPLRYALVPHDLWGEQVISAIDRYFPLSLADMGEVNRVVHLKLLPERGTTTISEHFPERQLRAILSDEAAGLTWQRHCNDLNTVWHSNQTRHALWTATANENIGTLRFHLPWDLLLHDLAKLGGGLIHGGVAVHNHRAWLFLAPPDGGKSTILATAPPGWQVPSDDAALLWPEADGHWLVSPLPSWSYLLSPESAGKLTAPLATDPVNLAGLLELNKAAKIHFDRLAPAATAALVYRSLNEYPVVSLADHDHHECFFRCAARLARAFPCWRLDLPLGGDIWTKFLPLSEPI